MSKRTAIIDPTSEQREQLGAAGDPQPPLPSLNGEAFNWQEFRVSQTFADHAGGQKLLTTVPVRKPSKESWFRTDPDEERRLQTACIELKEENEIYLIKPDLRAELMTDATFVLKLLIPTVTRQGDLLLWPLRMPGADGKTDAWSRSALEAADIARKKWVRLCAKKSLGAYEIIVAPDPQPEAIWPTAPMNEIIRIAFKDRIIDTLDHPVIRQLRRVV
jgi:hypothetical protein